MRPLLGGEEVDFTLADKTHPMTFANTDFGCINLDDPIPIHVGGFGPRARALAEMGDGLITGLPRGGTISQAMANVRRGTDRAKQSLDDFKVYALVNLLILEPGETLESERVTREIGSAEAPFITPEMIRTFSIAGQPEKIAECLRELERERPSRHKLRSDPGLAISAHRGLRPEGNCQDIKIGGGQSLPQVFARGNRVRRERKVIVNDLSTPCRTRELE